MLTFITCLKHPLNVKSMPTMLALLERTLESIEAQTNKNYQIVVVCHEIPHLSRTFKNIEFILVDFPAPLLAGDLAGELNVGRMRESLEEVKLDKGRKYLHALYHLRQNPPRHVMFFDADDCLSEDIVETVAQGPQETSWYIGHGYIYSEGSSWIVERKNDFNTYCGTCYIVNFDIYSNLPANIGDISDAWIKDNLGSHRLLPSLLQKRGIILKKIPYPAVVYIINTGENHSGLLGYGVWVSRRGGIVRWVRFMTRIFSFRRMNEKIKKKYNVRPLLLP